MVEKKAKSDEPKASIDQMKEAVSNVLLPGLETKTFNSGKKGFFTQGKLVVEGERYQAQVTLVKIEKKD